MTKVWTIEKFRSVELIVQPGANDVVSEMGVRGDLPPARIGAVYYLVWIVERASHDRFSHSRSPTKDNDIAPRRLNHIRFIGNMISIKLDEARRIAANVAKLPELVHKA